MVLVCSAKGCSHKPSKNSSLSFHKFPSNPTLLDQWLAVLDKKNWKPTKNSKLCSAHFLKSDFYTGLEHPRLKEFAVPSQNLSINYDSTLPEFAEHSYVSSAKQTPNVLNIEENIACLSIVGVLEDQFANSLDFGVADLPTETDEIVQDESIVDSNWEVDVLMRIEQLEKENAELRKSQTNTIPISTQETMEILQSWNTALLNRVLYLEQKISSSKEDSINSEEIKQSTNSSSIFNGNPNGRMPVDHKYAASPESLKRKLANSEERLHKRQKLLDRYHHRLSRAMIKNGQMNLTSTFRHLFVD